MEERHEIIEFPKDLRMKVLLHKIGSVTRHWHRSLELLFVLEGTAHVIMMVANNINRELGTDYLNYGSCYYLLAELVSKFRTNSGGEAKSRLKYTKRLTGIMDYNGLYRGAFQGKP